MNTTFNIKDPDIEALCDAVAYTTLQDRSQVMESSIYEEYQLTRIFLNHPQALNVGFVDINEHVYHLARRYRNLLDESSMTLADYLIEYIQAFLSILNQVEVSDSNFYNLARPTLLTLANFIDHTLLVRQDQIECKEKLMLMEQ